MQTTNTFSNIDFIKTRCSVLISVNPNVYLDYKIDKPIQTGSIVKVSVGSRECIGCVWGPGLSNFPDISLMKTCSPVN